MNNPQLLEPLAGETALVAGVSHGQSIPASKLKFERENPNSSIASRFTHAMRKASFGAAHLAVNIGRSCQRYISNRPVVDEWMIFAIAEAEEELRRQADRNSSRTHHAPRTEEHIE